MSQFVVAPNVAWAAVAAVSALGASTLVRLVALRNQPLEVVDQRIESLKTWWAVVGIVVGAALIGPIAIIALLAVISLLSLREFAAFPFEPMIQRRTLPACYVVILTSYTALLFGLTEAFTTVLPLAVVIVPSVVILLSGHASSFTQHIGRLTLAMLVTTYGLGHLGLLVSLPRESNPHAGPVGLFLFVVALTELNDIASALVGRKFGHHQLTVISPRKTWEGLVAGIVVTVLASILLGQWLTTISVAHSIAIGILMSLAGSLGDLNMSAIKREVGVKDSGRLLPGHGGMLDRIDSLTFTAPLFYHYWRWCFP
jgi:phosphatidate cytidylyltransferase